MWQLEQRTLNISIDEKWTTAGDDAAHEGHSIPMTSGLKINGELEQISILYCILSI